MRRSDRRAATAARAVALLFAWGCSLAACQATPEMIDGGARDEGQPPAFGDGEPPALADGGDVAEAGSPADDLGGADLAPRSDAAGPCLPHPRRALGTPSAGASWRYGGGAGYPDLVDPTHCRVKRAASAAQLEAALAAAQAGDVVYVDDAAAIDLTGKSLCIPAGVWLASGRGRGPSPGALLFTTVTTKTPILKACGADVRVTGLRLFGADPTECPPEYASKTCTGVDRTGGVNCRDCMPASYGLTVGKHDRLEVDNCELAGWSFAAISVADGKGHKLHHNHEHHTQRQGLGYGVVLGGAVTTALIEWNRFDYFRHAIAASGYRGQDYEARHNLSLGHANGHVYDVHGENEHLHDGSPYAGGRVLVHDNVIGEADQYSFVVRGRPEHGAWFYSNCTRRAAGSAAVQRYFTGNFHVDRSPTGSAPNRYSQTLAQCATTRWCFFPGGAGPQRNLVASGTALGGLRFGDFDGDGKTDVLRTDGGKWYWSRGGASGWAQLNTSSVPLAELGFGDFDGDGKTDVFHATGSAWRYSAGGSAPWANLRAATETLGSLAFGDFDGDGKTDVLKAAAGAWHWSRSGSAAWAPRNASAVALSSLRFGDFDGDGRTDAFRSDGAKWYVSAGAAGPWQTLNAASAPLTALGFADLDGDGKTDVLYADGTRWRVSAGGAKPWRLLTISSARVGDVQLADFDGDKRADAFRSGCY